MQYKTLFVAPNRVQLGLVAAKNITGVKFKTYPFCYFVAYLFCVYAKISHCVSNISLGEKPNIIVRKHNIIANRSCVYLPCCPFCFWVIFAIFGPSRTPVPTRTIYFKTGRRGAVPTRQVCFKVWYIKRAVAKCNSPFCFNYSMLLKPRFDILNGAALLRVNKISHK